ncbi:hypothetical protein FHW83_005568 [Duganella sp. SG902]|uniref:PEP-CTERM sorting domain-containing protein n=1 Tax=Duganella sp. SG902 TaxID=2587016 RepID=UPI00159D3626|nr:PEP-CTERM sorting domain-containing protein [Duganella sp. SG902]NVM79727.1 hypothetical protein [Duganella sp. SG902]
MKFKTALKAAAVAATLIFSTASHAEITYSPTALGVVFDGGSMLNPAGPGQQGVEVYELADTSLADAILAFCVQPTVAQLVGTSYTAHANASLSSLFADNGLQNRAGRIQSLFEQQYAGLTTGHTETDTLNRLAFQLALWDLVADDGNLGTGLQAFTGDAAAFGVVNGDFVPMDLSVAQSMLTHADGTGLNNSYKFTLFTGRADGSAVDNSQALLSVSAVPEADAWAMMAAGLALVGFMGRRKSRQGEKFAA